MAWAIENFVPLAGPTLQFVGDHLRSQQRRLFHLLLNDQSMIGPHWGQFGRGASLSESKQYNPGRESVRNKPRMYMTRWPCYVLGKHALAPRAVARAVRAVDKLLAGGVILGEEEWPSIPTQQPRLLTNFRHTMCGAMLLLEQRGWNDTAESVVGRMLDPSAQWQQADGGWPLTSPVPAASDLFASLYAIQLLDAVVASNRASGLTVAAEMRLQATLDFLDGYWCENEWSYGPLSSEEIFPQVLIEVGPILRGRRKNTFDAAVAKLMHQLNPAGGLTDGYWARSDNSVPEERRCARMAYALFRMGQDARVWRKLTQEALSVSLKRQSAAELAFLLDMVNVSDAGPNVPARLKNA